MARHQKNLHRAQTTVDDRNPALPYLKDEMSLKSRGPIPLYYELLYGI